MKILAMLVLILCAAACSGQAATDPEPMPVCRHMDIPGETEVIENARASDGVFSVPEPDAATVDKWFVATQVTGSGASSYYVPANYGGGAVNIQRCPNNAGDWTDDCSIPRNRRVKLSIELEACEAYDVDMAYHYVDSITEFAAWLRTNAGWEVIEYGPDFQPKIAFRCWNDGDNSGMITFRNKKSTCWNVPGAQHDLCFFNASGGSTYLNLDYIDDQLQSDARWRVYNLITNMVRHEMLHSVGIGHYPGGLMNNGVIPVMKSWVLAVDSTTHYALKQFNHDNKRCNWLPGDPIGDACPNEY